jgi:hypothetical protein
MTAERDRVISVSLTEAEWQAFVARHPQPVDWIRGQILSQLEGAREAAPSKERRPETTGTSTIGRV